MKVEIESTDQLVTLVINGVDVPARLWTGTTANGVEVHAYLTRISPQTHDPDQLRQFEVELQEVARFHRPPIDMRYVL